MVEGLWRYFGEADLANPAIPSYDPSEEELLRSVILGPLVSGLPGGFLLENRRTCDVEG